MSELMEPIRSERQPVRSYYRNVLAAFLEKPWAILPSKLAQIQEVIVLRASGERFTEEEILERLGAAKPRGRAQQSGAVAVIPIYGTIMPRADAFTQMSGGTSMDTFIAAMNQAAADPNVTSILLDVDSPGGQVDMVPEAAAAIRTARSQKRVTAVANTMAASAAYWLASQADELVISPSGEVGSIGVFAAHQDMSKQHEMLGVQTTLISAGKYKTELSPLAPLSAEAQAHVQETINEYYGMFTKDVAAGRRIGVAEVRGGFGEGRMVTAQQAVREGMGDRVDTFDNTVNKMLRLKTPVSPAAAVSMSSGSGSWGNFTVTDGVAIGTSSTTEVQLNVERQPITFAGAIPYAKTEVIDEPWDGPGEEAKLPNDGGEEVFRPMYAWSDDGADEDTKAAYKFPHHKVVNGKAGPANVNGVRAALSRLPQANIPEGDRAGVEAHLNHHLDDFKASNAALAVPQEQLAELRRESRATAIGERESYLSLLRRLNK